MIEAALQGRLQPLQSTFDQLRLAVASRERGSKGSPYPRPGC